MCHYHNKNRLLTKKKKQKLREPGASLKYVSNRLGHKSINTTADTYFDITKKIKGGELQKFASYTRNRQADNFKIYNNPLNP
nr:hypothetical protein [Bacillus sp. G16]